MPDLFAAKNHVLRRQRFQNKKSTRRYKIRRKNRLKEWKQGNFFRSQKNHKNNFDPVNIVAPEHFKFIDNTDEVLTFIEKGRKALKAGYSTRFDISKIESLSPDAITLLISHLISFRSYGSMILGNAPDDEEMKEFFTSSGFYNYVRSPQKFESSDKNLMHKESNVKVKPEIAEKATMLIINNGKYDDENIEVIYNIFIEMMSNTHHHASPEKFGISKWVIYVYNDTKNETTSVSFIDLGVGIFKSIIVRNYLKKIASKIPRIKNLILVDDLLSGKIGSRIEVDNEIRGKGIPQILEYSKLPFFKKFYLITNEVKINLKTGEKVELDNDFGGTFYYFELCSKIKVNGNNTNN